MLLVEAVSPYPPHPRVHNYDNHELGQTPIGDNRKLGQPRGDCPYNICYKAHGSATTGTRDSSHRINTTGRLILSP